MLALPLQCSSASLLDIRESRWERSAGSRALSVPLPVQLSSLLMSASPRVRGWRRLTGALSARGREWVARDRGGGVLASTASTRLRRACERGGSSSPPGSAAEKHLALPRPPMSGCPASPGVCWGAVCRVGMLLRGPAAGRGLRGAGFFPLVLQPLGRGEEDLGRFPLPGAGGEAGENVDASCRRGGCWGEDGAERLSSGSRAHGAGTPPANPVADLTYIWGQGGGSSAAADGAVKSPGSGWLPFRRPLAPVRERTGLPLAARQPSSSCAAPWGRSRARAAPAAGELPLVSAAGARVKIS